MLKGKKVQLRAIEPTDVNMMLLWENDSENWHVSETLAPFSKFLIESYLQSAQDIYVTKQIRFVIESIETNEPVGLLDFFEYAPRHQRAGLGILIEKNSRKEGFATDAIEIAKVYAKSIDLHQIFCSIGADNVKSIRLFEKAGFVETGLKRDWRKLHGKWTDELDFQYIIE